MILQALFEYYEALASQGKIARPGWAKADVYWALEIDEYGNLLDVLPLCSPSQDGKKMVPQKLKVPAQMKRSGKNAPSFFLCDNTQYFFGIEAAKVGEKTVPAITDKSKRAFSQFKAEHERRLSAVNHPMAKAIVAFVNRYSPEDFLNMDFLKEKEDMLIGNRNCVFISQSGVFAQDIPEIADAVVEQSESSVIGTCLVTGKQDEIARIHNSVKGLAGNSPNGWTLVSFDKDSYAYSSFGKEQGYNAPVGKYAAFAYVTALNHLLSETKHKKTIGNITLVYWADGAEEQYQDSFSDLYDGPTVSNTDLNALMETIAAGEPYIYDGLPVSPENDFYLLGLSPSSTRIAVRFFYRRSFGEIVRNLKRHYEDIQIVSDGRSKQDNMPLWALLRETVNQKSSDKSPLPQLAGDVMKSMLTGSRYPETLMNQTLLRIRAEHEITRGKAGIVKAYLRRNTANLPAGDSIMEVAQVSLNAESSYTPYVLGRLFAVLEGAQQAANPGINATIKDRFFNAACATPAAVFPILLKLSNSHLKKLDAGKAVYWSKQIGELANRLGDGFPAHLSLQEQGSFILGYYHQTQKRFEKKNDKEAE